MGSDDDAVRRSAPWMIQADDRILEFLDDHDWASSEQIAAEATPAFSAPAVRERLALLARADLVARLWRDGWVITGWGRRYLDGESLARSDGGRRPVA